MSTCTPRSVRSGTPRTSRRATLAGYGPQLAGEIARAARRDLLAPVYEWFTEGFDTPDLIEANALFDNWHSRHPFSAGLDARARGSTGRLAVDPLQWNQHPFRPCVSATERNYKLGACHRSAKLLICLPKRSGYRMGQVNGRRESRALESASEPSAPVQGAQPSTKNGRIPRLFRADQQTERMSA
jgi:hypothetical protein